MKNKKIHVIVNPASGREEPILSYLNTCLDGKEFEWELTVTKSGDDVQAMAKALVGTCDIIAMYGGDGSVTKVAQALAGTDTVLAVLPGGTANVLAKELGLPHDSLEALKLLGDGSLKQISIDMASFNNQCFVLRINFGILADMILEADRSLKDKLGQAAYGITALKAMSNAEMQVYKMRIDGEDVSEKGVALTITNAGNIGIGDYTFLPEISIRDGFLDVILMHEASLLSYLRLAGTTLAHTDSAVLKHWKCRELSLKLEHPVKYIVDDSEEEAAEFLVKVMPSALKVLVPMDYAG